MRVIRGVSYPLVRVSNTICMGLLCGHEKAAGFNLRRLRKLKRDLVYAMELVLTRVYTNVFRVGVSHPLPCFAHSTP